MQQVSSAVRGRADVYVVDVDESPELAMRWDIRSLPTLLIFKNGKVVEKVRDSRPGSIKERLLSYVD